MAISLNINLCRSLRPSQSHLACLAAAAPTLAIAAVVVVVLISRLKLLLQQAVLEEHENRDLGAVLLVAVLQHAHHAVAVHGLAGEELQILEAAQDVLGRLVHVRLEGVHLVGVLLRQLLDDPEIGQTGEIGG